MDNSEVKFEALLDVHKLPNPDDLEKIDPLPYGLRNLFIIPSKALLTAPEVSTGKTHI
jgi:hypothetical protein